MTSSVTLVDREQQHRDDADPSGRSRGREAPGRVLEVLRTLERHPRRAPLAHGGRSTCGDGLLGLLDGVGPRRAAPRRSSVTPPPRAVSCDSTISA